MRGKEKDNTKEQEKTQGMVSMFIILIVVTVLQITHMSKLTKFAHFKYVWIILCQSFLNKSGLVCFLKNTVLRHHLWLIRFEGIKV